MKKILVLFPKDWDRVLFAQREYTSCYRFFYEGFDLFRFPGNARLLSFDIFRFVEKLYRKYRRTGLDGILSNNEQFGALAAALLARRFGLPGLNPVTLVTAQHKFQARELLNRRLPALMPRYCAFPYSVRSPSDIALEFPFFVKPVKATYSVLARRVDDFADLTRHLAFKPWERYLIKRLVRPFNDAAAALANFAIDAHHLIGESLIEGDQVSVEGYVVNGEVHIAGLIDAVMYPGTNAFMRWDYPSRLPEEARLRAVSAARDIILALNYDHGFFNVELAVNERDGSIKLIEVNPRMASQFSDLFEKVHGVSLHQIAVRLSYGDAPVNITPNSGRYSHATSFVFRKFDGNPLAHPPARADLDWLKSFDPDAHLMLYLKRGAGLRREMKWLGSHRYAVLNMGGTSEAKLLEKYRTVKERLRFETG